jgi:hypothetical protein
LFCNLVRTRIKSILKLDVRIGCCGELQENKVL